MDRFRNELVDGRGPGLEHPVGRAHLLGARALDSLSRVALTA